MWARYWLDSSVSGLAPVWVCSIWGCFSFQLGHATTALPVGSSPLGSDSYPAPPGVGLVGSFSGRLGRRSRLIRSRPGPAREPNNSFPTTNHPAPAPRADARARRQGEAVLLVADGTLRQGQLAEAAQHPRPELGDRHDHPGAQQRALYRACKVREALHARVPVQDATWPRLDYTKCSQLTFREPDRETYPALDLAYAAGPAAGTMTGDLSPANHQSVPVLIDGKVRQPDTNPRHQDTSSLASEHI